MQQHRSLPLRYAGKAFLAMRERAPSATSKRPNEAIWVLRCKNTAYRLRLVPGMGAKVSPVHLTTPTITSAGRSDVVHPVHRDLSEGLQLCPPRDKVS